jgi:hypothetical protein
MNEISAPTSAASSSRRVFLTRAAAVGLLPLAAGLLIYQKQGAAPSAVSAKPAVLPLLADFQPAIGSSFVSVGDDSQLSLVLAKAEPSKRHQPGKVESFSLRFTAPEGQPLESRIYHLQHAALGTLALFITPVGSSIVDGQQQKGEAVIHFTPRQA